MIKILRLYILFLVLTAAAGLVFADTAAMAPSPASSAPASPSAQAVVQSKENNNQIREKVKQRAVFKRNQKREERIQAYYEKGVKLSEEGDSNGARACFEKAIRIADNPEMSGYIKESQPGAPQIKEEQDVLQQKVESSYQQAADLYKQRKYHASKNAFVHVEATMPDYRGTRSYLKVIDQDIAAEAAQQQKQEAVRQQKEVQVIHSQQKETQHRAGEAKEKQHKDEIARQTAVVYGHAVDLYKRKKFAEAKKKFEEVNWVTPDYKATMYYLHRIDKDAQDEQQRVAAEQQKALQEEHWQEIVTAKKAEAQRQYELEVKEREHKKQLDQQAQIFYKDALNLYDQKNMDAALQKFNDIENADPDYRSTRLYIARIKEWQFEQQKDYEEQKTRQLQQERKEHQRMLEKEVEGLYLAAVDHYNTHDFGTARDGFIKVQEKMAGYKDTDLYLNKITAVLSEAAGLPGPATAMPPEVPSPAVRPVSPVQVTAVPETPSVMPAQVKVAVSLEEQQKQARDIAALAEKSAQLYRQISDVADDKTTAATKKKMAQVDELVNNMKEQQDHLLRQMEEEKWREQQQEAREKLEQQRADAEKMYQDGLEFLRLHDYAKARIKFLELEGNFPDYKATRRYLARIDGDLKRSNVEAVTAYEKKEAQHLNQLQQKENMEAQRRVQEATDQQRILEQKQQAQLADLAQKASSINDDIIRLSQAQDYEGMKVKFQELENTVTALTALKDEMAKNKDRLERQKQLDQEALRRRNEMIREQRDEDRQIHAYDMTPETENRPVLSHQFDDAEQYKRREITHEQTVLFSEAVDCYEHKKYTEAKLLFGELADQHDRRAQAWLIKVDRAISRELLNSQEGEERERTAFIAEQLRAQRELAVIQERERIRQKKLTEELERQTRLYEDDRLLQRRKEEDLKAQERERRRQEAKRLQMEKESEEQQEAYRFHKVEPQVNAQPQTSAQGNTQPNANAQTPSDPPPVKATVSDPPPVVVNPVSLPAPIPAAAVIVAPPALTPAQLREQARQAKIQAEQAAREKRKEEKQREIERREQLKAQQEQEREAKIQAEQATREKIKEERQKEIERQEQLKAEQEKMREAKIQAEQAAREKIKEERQKEIERREQLKAQQEQERLARIKAAEEAREKLKEEKQKEMERQEQLRAQQEQERQAKIKAAEEAREKIREQAEQERRHQEELKAQEEQRKEELMRQQAQEQEEKLKEEQVMREEAQHQADLERQERERQAQLDAQRETVRKQLEDGVEAMYQEALALYKQGEYSEAADKFKDVDDILPGYKRAVHYMNDAHRRAIAAASASNPSVTSSDVSPSAPPSDSHQDSVSKALDLFDPNAK